MSGSNISKLQNGFGSWYSIELEGPLWLFQLFSTAQSGRTYVPQFPVQAPDVYGYPRGKGLLAPAQTSVEEVREFDQSAAYTARLNSVDDYSEEMFFDIREELSQEPICTEPVFDENQMDENNNSYLAYQTNVSTTGPGDSDAAYSVYCKKVENLSCPLGEQNDENTYDAYYRKIVSQMPTRFFTFNEDDIVEWMDTVEVYAIQKEIPSDPRSLPAPSGTVETSTDPDSVVSCEEPEYIFEKVGTVTQLSSSNPDAGEWKWVWDDRDPEEFPDGRYTLVALTKPSHREFITLFLYKISGF